MAVSNKTCYTTGFGLGLAQQLFANLFKPLLFKEGGRPRTRNRSAPWSSLERQNLRSHIRPTESESTF